MDVKVVVSICTKIHNHQSTFVKFLQFRGWCCPPTRFIIEMGNELFRVENTYSGCICKYRHNLFQFPSDLLSEIACCVARFLDKPL